MAKDEDASWNASDKAAGDVSWNSADKAVDSGTSEALKTAGGVAQDVAAGAGAGFAKAGEGLTKLVDAPGRVWNLLLRTHLQSRGYSDAAAQDTADRYSPPTVGDSDWYKQHVQPVFDSASDFWNGAQTPEGKAATLKAAREAQAPPPDDIERPGQAVTPGIVSDAQAAGRAALSTVRNPRALPAAAGDMAAQLVSAEGAGGIAGKLGGAAARIANNPVVKDAEETARLADKMRAAPDRYGPAFVQAVTDHAAQRSLQANKAIGAATRAGARAGTAATFGAQSATSAQDQFVDSVRNMPLKELRRVSPRAAALLDQGMTEDEVRAAIIESGVGPAGALGFLAGAVGAEALPGPQASRLARAAGTTASLSAQAGAAQAGQNLAATESGLDPNRSLGQGVPEAAAAALPGAAVVGGVSGLRKPAPAPAAPAPESGADSHEADWDAAEGKTPPPAAPPPASAQTTSGPKLGATPEEAAQLAALDQKIKAESNPHVQKVLKDQRKAVQDGVTRRDGAVRLQQMAVDALKAGDKPAHDLYMAKAEELNPTTPPASAVGKVEEPAQVTLETPQEAGETIDMAGGAPEPEAATADPSGAEPGESAARENLPTGEVGEIPGEAITLESQKALPAPVRAVTPEGQVVPNEPVANPPTDEELGLTPGTKAAVVAQAARDAALKPPAGFNVTKAVGLAGGKTLDGKRGYISRKIPQFLDVPTRSGGTARIPVWEEIAAHEDAEHPNIAGKGYDKAHVEDGNGATAKFLDKYDVDPRAYQNVLRPHLRAAELDALQNPKDVPSDLDHRPYIKGNGMADVDNSHTLPNSHPAMRARMMGKSAKAKLNRARAARIKELQENPNGWEHLHTAERPSGEAGAGERAVRPEEKAPRSAGEEAPPRAEGLGNRDEGVKDNAAETGKQQRDGGEEHRGATQGSAVPKDGGQAREENRAEAGNRNRDEGSGAEQQPARDLDERRIDRSALRKTGARLYGDRNLQEWQRFQETITKEADRRRLPKQHIAFLDEAIKGADSHADALGEKHPGDKAVQDFVAHLKRDIREEANLTREELGLPRDISLDEKPLTQAELDEAGREGSDDGVVRDLPDPGFEASRRAGSKAPASSTGHKAADIREALVDEFGEDTISNLERSGKLRIVGDYAGLDKREAEFSRTTGGVRAFFDKKNGRATLIANRLPVAEAASTLVHELGIHKGARGLLGEKGFSKLLTDISDLKNKGDKAMQDAWSHVQENYPHLDENSHRFKEEVAARLAEIDKDSPFVQRLMTGVRTALYRLGFTRALSDDVVRSIAIKALRREAVGASKLSSLAHVPFEASARSSETGMAHRIGEAKGTEADRGDVATKEESIARGERLIKGGVDPHKFVADAIAKKNNSADAFAVAAAQLDRLERAENEAADKYGDTSPEYQKAVDAEQAWRKHIKPMQTQWAEQGLLQQGSPIDTSSAEGLRKAYSQSTGKAFTPKQSEEAKAKADAVKKADAGVRDTQDALNKTIRRTVKPTKEDVLKDYKPGSDWTTEQANALWTSAKLNYFNKGVTDFSDIRHGLALDYNIPVADVTRGLATNKALRTVTDDMYKAAVDRRRVVNQAKDWVTNQKYPAWQNMTKKIPRAFFSLATFGHGTVGMITHAGNQMFNPLAVKDYWKNFARQFRFYWSGLKGGAYHEQMMQDLMRDPNFVKARRAGLANDPFHYTDDYQNKTSESLFGRLGTAGNKGFDALKMFRQDRFNRSWEGLPEHLQTPEMAELLADSINHATGVTRSNFGGSSIPSTILFAPKLEASRWAYLIGDPTRAALTFAGWSKATPEMRRAAVQQVRDKALMVGTYASLLAINQGLLSASGSDQKINFSDPTKGDWLSFKVAGHKVGIISPMIRSIRFLTDLVHDSLQQDVRKAPYDAWEYVRTKLSPIAKVASDIAFPERQFDQKQLPWSKHSGEHETVPEYLTKNFLPIPFQEAAQGTWKGMGMGEDTSDALLASLIPAAIVGSTGARITDDTTVKR